MHLTNLMNRALFVVAVVLAGLALWEKLANLFGYTVLRTAYTPWRLMEFAAVALLFVIAHAASGHPARTRVEQGDIVARATPGVDPAGVV